MSGSLGAEAAHFMQTASSRVLAAAAAGGLDLNRLARQTLAARGLDFDGRWVGFEAAERLLDAFVKAERAP